MAWKRLLKRKLFQDGGNFSHDCVRVGGNDSILGLGRDTFFDWLFHLKIGCIYQACRFPLRTLNDVDQLVNISWKKPTGHVSQLNNIIMSKSFFITNIYIFTNARVTIFLQLPIQIWREIHQSSKCGVDSLINSGTSNYISLWGLFFTCLYESLEKLGILPRELLGRIWFCEVKKKFMTVSGMRVDGLEIIWEDIWSG